MRLLEHEGKDLLRRHGLAVPDGQVVRSLSDELRLNFPVVVKAQIPEGGRGKAGGIVRVTSIAEYHQAARKLLGQRLLGSDVRALLAEEQAAVVRELYLAIVFDRQERALRLLAHENGGVDIEEAVKGEPPLSTVLHKMPGKKQAERVREYFSLSAAFAEAVHDVLVRLWAACVEEDALLAEINPLATTEDAKLLCLDAKLVLDDAAAFRHSEWAFAEEPASSQFAELNREGTVGSMANGAGLAMATVDAIAAAGALPANFYDVGGGSNVAAMVRAFERVAAMPNVRAIVVNIFGGITRCDEVAAAIIEAKQTSENLPPLFIRLTGTNEAEAKDMLQAANISFVATLAECVRAAVAETKHV